MDSPELKVHEYPPPPWGLDRTSRIKVYKNNARSRLFLRIAKRSIDKIDQARVNSSTDYRALVMAKMYVFCVLLITLLLAASTTGFRCRDGIKNSVGHVWRVGQYCGDNVNKTKACFQSLKCTKIGDTPYKDYEWRCFERKNCQNGTDGKSYGRYSGIRGICCFTSRCNAYLLNTCTDFASRVKASIIGVVTSLLLSFVIA